MSKIMSPFLALSFATVLSDFSLFTLLSFGQVGSKRKRTIERERERGTVGGGKSFVCSIHSNERAHGFLLHQKAC